MRVPSLDRHLLPDGKLARNIRIYRFGNGYTVVATHTYGQAVKILNREWTVSIHHHCGPNVKDYFETIEKIHFFISDARLETLLQGVEKRKAFN